MRFVGKLGLYIILVLALALTTTPVLAQGKGKGQEKKNHPHQVEKQNQKRNNQAQRANSRGNQAQRPQLERRDRNAQTAAASPQVRQKQRGPHGAVPPGWCLGRGNPHNTPENCGHWNGRNWDWQSRDNRQFQTFEEAHAAFHRVHDQRCRERASERPLDPAWQVRVRAECRAEHDRWHERYDPNWRG